MSDNSALQDPFREIRPYRDTEVAEVLNRLLYNDEFIRAVTRYGEEGARADEIDKVAAEESGEAG